MLIYIKLFLMAVFWGGTFVAGRVVAREVGPFSGAFLRFVIASVMLFVVTRRREGSLPAITKGQAFRIFLLGMTGVFAYNVFFLKGLKLISASRASLIIANNPVFIAFFSTVIFRERLTSIKGAGIVLSVTGATIVITHGNLGVILGNGLGWGELYILGCVASWVAFSLMAKSVITRLSPLVSVFYTALAGTLILFLPACVEGMLSEVFGYSMKSWIGILYLAIFGTVLGVLWYYEGIDEVGPTRAGQFINFVPLSAVVLAFLIIGERLTFSLGVGALFVLSGVYLTNRPSCQGKPETLGTRVKSG